MKRQWLSELRKNKKLSYEEMAKELGVTGQFIYYVETGQKRPKPETAQKWGDLLGFDWTLFYPKREQKE